MKFDGNLSYLFNTGNNNGLIKNVISPVYDKSCTVLCRYTPDLEGMMNAMPDIGFLSTGILCKNGQHIGIFFKQIKNYEGQDPWLYRFSFEFWQKNFTEQTILDIDIDYNTIEGRTFDISFTQTHDTFTFTVDGETVSTKYDKSKLIDYSNSYLWIGCANRLAPDWKHELIGEIHKMYIDLDITLPYSQKLFFDDYEAFNNKILNNKSSKAVFLSNFKKYTYYKIHDDSGNGNHPIKYDEEWIS